MIAVVETRVHRLDVTDVTLPSLHLTWARLSLTSQYWNSWQPRISPLSSPALHSSFPLHSSPKTFRASKLCFVLENYKSLPRESLENHAYSI